jgi:hypothetical protein
MAEIALWADMWAVTGLTDDAVESVFMRPFADLQDALDAAFAAKGRDAKVLFLMDGCVTVPMVQ